MKSKNTERLNLSSPILDKNYISNIKSEFEELLGDDETPPTTLEYFENFNDYFLKYPDK